ncbi:MAG: bifunctional diaminohydroxyphosphoribosylaminopyrimidine deaminase/5-amino-6-(5-phosphoribosylamino)uracil reductase RibD [Bacteroidales bacterium]|nr:bifunctional diaminohydroxyphosphoribosylaminopyrimidine deaminase/5-amino-6-(5-phosphoribosylamino)uracil reductase RibD [Bacteroidales bacterium]
METTRRFWSETDKQYMQEAIALAERGYGHTAPNPMVGCVLVKDGRTIGRGWHRQYGDLHAEREALAACTEDPAGATAYVTLEPCCHHGKQPPCTDALLEAGIARVVVGLTDPNPLVCGKGIEILREHGVKVEVGLMADKIREQNRIFLKYITERRPWVTLKVAMTLDGKIATADGDSRWVTSPRARVFVHRLRGGHSGICVGAGTVRADNPMLDCRLTEYKNPVRILPDSLASLSPESRIAQSARSIRTILVHTEAADIDRLKQLRDCGVETLACKTDNGRIDLRDMLCQLGAQGIDSILLEGGEELNGSFFEQGLVDEYYFFVAPKILGGREALSAIGGNGFAKMADALAVNIDSIRHFGQDFLLHGYPEKK